MNQDEILETIQKISTADAPSLGSIVDRMRLVVEFSQEYPESGYGQYLTEALEGALSRFADMLAAHVGS